MKHLTINNKHLPIPSFFQVYNFGGGNGDKDREYLAEKVNYDISMSTRTKAI